MAGASPLRRGCQARIEGNGRFALAAITNDQNLYVWGRARPGLPVRRAAVIRKSASHGHTFAATLLPLTIRVPMHECGVYGADCSERHEKEFVWFQAEFPAFRAAWF